MKHWLIILLICIFTNVAYGQAASREGGKFGLGLTLLGPTGITGKYLIDEKLSFEGSLGFGSFGQGRFHLHGVVTYNFYQINESLSLYGGGGLVLEERKYRNGERSGRGSGRGLGRLNGIFDDDFNYEKSLGIRAPIGISWRNADRKFELSGEAYLNLFLRDKNTTDLGIALAARYYF